jgi:hypothetical protein
MISMESKHTPGPWRQGAYLELVMAGNTAVAEVYVDGCRHPGSDEEFIASEEANANAALIAAAPDMYEALRHAASSYHHPKCKAKGDYAGNPELYCTCHVQKARAALAKAEGR